MNNFLGMKIFCGYFFGSSQNWIIIRGHLIYAFQGLFLRSRYRIGDTFGGCLNFKYFLGVLEIHNIFGVNGGCWARAYV